jgi:farnesol kinase
MLIPQNPVLSDVCATAISGAVALSSLRFWEETAKRGVFDKKLNRKLLHISIGLLFILCWPLFSAGRQGLFLAAIIPGVNIIRMLLVGLGVLKDEAIVMSMSRYGDRRELLKGPLYYAASITAACLIYWRTSPIAIAAICNLCAGDGMADIVGRRFGHQKLPYNKNKSIAGSVAMASAGFLASLGYMYYFNRFGYIQESWEMALGFLVISLVSALVESLPISTELDDNLTVTVTSILVGSLVF